MHTLKSNKSWYIALFMVSGFIKNLFSIDCVNLHLFQYFFNRFWPVDKCGVIPHCSYHDSLTLDKRIFNLLLLYSLHLKTDAIERTDLHF